MPEIKEVKVKIIYTDGKEEEPSIPLKSFEDSHNYLDAVEQDNFEQEILETNLLTNDD